jgi:chaperonin GroES
MAKKHSKQSSKASDKAVTANGISSKIKPLADRIVIKEDTESAEKQTSSGIIIPAGADSDKGGKRGEVVAVGPGRTEEGKIVAPSVRIGDKVLFQWGDKVRIGEDDYYIVRESEILAVVK